MTGGATSEIPPNTISDIAPPVIVYQDPTLTVINRILVSNDKAYWVCIVPNVEGLDQILQEANLDRNVMVRGDFSTCQNLPYISDLPLSIRIFLTIFPLDPFP